MQPPHMSHSFVLARISHPADGALESYPQMHAHHVPHQTGLYREGQSAHVAHPHLGPDAQMHFALVLIQTFINIEFHMALVAFKFGGIVHLHVLPHVPLVVLFAAHFARHQNRRPVNAFVLG